MKFLLIQSIGFLGLILYGYSFQLKDTKKLLHLQALSSLIFAVQFFLLHAWTGMALFLVNTSKILLFAQMTIRPKWVLGTYITIFAVTGYFTYDHWFSVLVTLGFIFGAISRWQKDSQKLKRLSSPGIVMCIIYDLFAGSYTGALTETVVLFSAIIGYFRGKQKSPSPEQL